MLLGYLKACGGWPGAKVASSKCDPPDCFGVGQYRTRTDASKAVAEVAFKEAW